MSDQTARPLSATLRAVPSNRNQYGPARPIADRFWDRVDGDVDGCWEWTGHIDTSGYGVVPKQGGNLRASRVSWVLTYGDVPDGLCVLHHCDNRKCVRPDHLFLGTQGDNQRDAVAKGRWHVTHPTFWTGEARWPK